MPIPEPDFPVEQRKVVTFMLPKTNSFEYRENEVRSLSFFGESLTLLKINIF